jgi:alpha-amylase
MADDLGDSHANSLRQGGALPAGSAAPRTAGRIHASLARAVSVNVFQEAGGQPVRCWIEDASGAALAVVTNTSTLALNHTPDESGWLTLKVANAAATNASQRVWVKAAYSAPRDLHAPARITLRDAELNGASLQFQITGPSEVQSVIEASSDLLNWGPLTTNEVPSLFQTTTTTGHRYFRVRALAR